MAGEKFVSAVGAHIEGLIALKRSLGFRYEGQLWALRQFDRFCDGWGLDRPELPRGLVLAWCGRRPREGGSCQRQRVTPVRQLALHMASLGLDAHVPNVRIRVERTVPYIPTEAEVASLLEAADADVGRPGLERHIAIGHGLALRLMWCLGLRLSECCGIEVADVDLADGSIRVMRSKGGKDRIVYMGDDLAAAVAAHIAAVARLVGPCRWLLPGRDPSLHVHKATLCSAIRRLWDLTPHARPGGRHPTCHSLRHAFVVNRMLRWAGEGVDLDAMMPYLSAHLGHEGPGETMYYYHQVRESFAAVRSRDTVAPRAVPEVVLP